MSGQVFKVAGASVFVVGAAVLVFTLAPGVRGQAARQPGPWSIRSQPIGGPEIGVHVRFKPSQGDFGAIEAEREARRQAAANGRRQQTCRIRSLIAPEGRRLVDLQRSVRGFVENDAEFITRLMLDDEIEPAGSFRCGHASFVALGMPDAAPAGAPAPPWRKNRLRA